MGEGNTSPAPLYKGVKMSANLHCCICKSIKPEIRIGQGKYLFCGNCFKKAKNNKNNGDERLLAILFLIRKGVTKESFYMPLTSKESNNKILDLIEEAIGIIIYKQSHKE